VTNATNTANATKIIQKTKEKIYVEEFDTYLQESTEKFVNWVLS
jgi:hypothetical protein